MTYQGRLRDLYADDNALTLSGANTAELNANLLRSLGQAQYWMTKNHLTLNLKKTVNMCYGTSQKLRQIGEINLELNENKVQQIQTF